MENTATSNFWETTVRDKSNNPLCSACDPEIGEWHNIFPRIKYDGSQKVDWIDGVWLQ